MTKLPFTLDHIGVVVPDVPAAGQAYQKLGFTITPQSSHKRQRPDGGFDPLGTGNHCVMLRRGYLELIGITDPGLPHDSLKARLERYHGLQLIALGTRDAATVEAAWLAAAGQGVRPLTPLGRDVPQVEGGTKYGSFSIVYLESAAFPEAELFAIQHHSVDVLWQPALLDHANGAEGLVGLDLITPYVGATCIRLARLGLDVDPSGAVPSARFHDGGELVLLDPEQARRRYPGIALHAAPSVAAMRIAVASLSATSEYFRKNAIAFTAADGVLRVAPDLACGVVVDFVEETA